MDGVVFKFGGFHNGRKNAPVPMIPKLGLFKKTKPCFETILTLFHFLYIVGGAHACMLFEYIEKGDSRGKT